MSWKREISTYFLLKKLIYLILNKFGDSDSKIINELMISFSKHFSVIKIIKFNPHLVKHALNAT